MNTSGKLSELNLGQDDLSKIIQLDQDFSPRPWRPEDWKNLNSEHFLLYAWRNNEFRAFALLNRVGQDEMAHLLKICVLPDFRGSGLSQEFWNGLIGDLRMKSVQSVFLEVEKTNSRAIKFYQKAGFETLRENKAYYSDGTAALTMKLTL